MGSVHETLGGSAARDASRRGAFTLVEMVMSLAVVTVLLGSMTSVLMLSLRAIDDRTNPSGKTVRAAEAVDLMLADLAEAQSFSERTAKAVTLKVGDRTGDGSAETIRYSWSGVAGAPLVREFNGVVDEGFAPDVRKLDFTYMLRSELPPCGP